MDLIAVSILTLIFGVLKQPEFTRNEGNIRAALLFRHPPAHPVAHTHEQYKCEHGHIAQY